MYKIGHLYVQNFDKKSKKVLKFVCTKWAKNAIFLEGQFRVRNFCDFWRFLQREYKMATNVEISTFSGILMSLFVDVFCFV